MTRISLALLLAAILATAAVAQTQTGNPQAAPGAAAPAKAAPAGPRPKSPEESAAIKAVAVALQNASGTPAQVDAAVQNLVTKFPQTEFKEWAYTLATKYHYQHNDYPGTLENGEAALKVDPHAVLPLLILANSIPARVQPTDLDRDQRLAEAAGYDQTALDFADHFPTTLNGNQLTPQQIAGYQRTIRATVHSSLAAIANDRGQFAQAAAEYRQAIGFESGQNQARDYYHLAVVQDEAKDYKNALDSIGKALALGTGDAPLQTLANAEKTKLTREMAPAGAPAHP